VIVPVNSTNQVAIYNHAGSVDVIADMQGYFAGLGETVKTGVPFTPLAPARLLDTRFGKPVGPDSG
jgi:hypothetical protein